METIIFIMALIGIAFIEGITAGTGMAAIFIMTVFGIMALVMVLKGSKAKAKEFGIKAGAYIILVAVLFGLNIMNGRIGTCGAERIAAACEEYKAKTGEYPEILEKLVPDYIKVIPAAKLSLRWSRYWLEDNKIIFVREPGVVVVTYDLIAKKWGFIPAKKIFGEKQ